MKKQFWITAVIITLSTCDVFSQEPILQDSLGINLTKEQDKTHTDKTRNFHVDQDEVEGSYTDLDISESDDSEFDSVYPKDRVELGLNISPLLQRVISPATPFNGNGQELVMLNVKVMDGVYWRNGFNASAQKVIDNEINDFTSTFSTIFLRSGFEWRSPIANKLELHVGVDAIFDRFASKFDFDDGNGSTSVSDRITNGVGVGVPLGLTYWFNERIGIWVESSLRATRSKLTNIDTFDGEEVGKQESVRLDLSIQLPVSLFVKMTF